MASDAREIWFAGGGTGGHLFPALAVADALRARRPGVRIVFVGSHRGLERRLVPRAGYPLRVLRMSGIKGLGPTDRLAGGVLATVALVRCLGWMVVRRPALVIGVGGYASGPPVLAARLLRVKTMVLEQNHYPGATNRWLAPRVDAVCVPSEAARRRLGGIGTVTGNPVRREFAAIGPAPAGAIPSLLVFGGSRGARSINAAMAGAVPLLGALDPAPRVVHQTGTEELESARAAWGDYPAGRAEIHAFLDDLPQRMADADLVVCRAGATTLAELAAAGRPALLVPYPHAADDHQRHNAQAVAEAGAAEVLLDKDLSGETLATRVAGLLADPDRRARMAEAAHGLARVDAAERIADLALALADDGGPANAGTNDVP